MTFTVTEPVTGAPLVVQLIVKVDWELIITFWAPERLEEERPGPETAQLFTCDAFHVIRDCVPVWTRDGLAEMDASG